MADQLWIVGALIAFAVLVQALLMTWDAIRRSRHQNLQRKRAAELLALRLEAAKKRRAAEEQKTFSWSGWRKFEVKRKQVEDPDGAICSFYLAPHDGKPIPSFEPGQFLTFQLKIPGQEKPTVRCYSLSDCFKPDGYRVTIKRIGAPRGTNHPPGLASCFFREQVKEGDILDVRAPSGKFTLSTSETVPVVLVGGGVGITPVLSMLNAIAESGGNRETWFFYGIRHSGEHVMKDHLESIARDHPSIHLHVCYSSPRDGDTLGKDYHHAGWVSVDLFKKLLPSNNYEFYVCGPTPMMNSITSGLEEWGVSKERVQYERFGPGAPKKVPEKPAVEAGPQFEISFAKSGKKVIWFPEAGTPLDLARANGVAIDSGCERGDCGTCQTAIRSGEVEYKERPAFEFEDGTCLACCCVPKGPLVLDA